MDKTLRARQANENKAGFELVEYRVGAPGYRDVASYDQKRYSGAAREYRQAVMARAYGGLIGPLQGKRVLDVGCGSGRGVAVFAGAAKFAAGCDASVDMLRYAARKLEGRTGWGLASAYAQQLPFASDSFDVVTALNFLHLFTLEAQRAMIAEMRRVVKPGGILVLEFDNAWHGLLAVGLYKRWFRDERGTLPWEARYVLGDGCRIVRVRTAALPIIWRLFYRAPRFFGIFENLSRLPGLGRIMGQRVYYKLQKENREARGE